jgi:hypothetical protein
MESSMCILCKENDDVAIVIEAACAEDIKVCAAIIFC